jgi:hypothetical protein
MDDKYMYLQLLTKGGPIIHHGDVCRFPVDMAGLVDPLQWKRLDSALEIMLALKDGHRLLDCGMPIDEYEAYMEKLKEEHVRKRCKVKS